MAKLTKLVINCETKEQTEIELTDEEIAQLEADRVKAEADRAAKEAADVARAATKAAVLERLGLTDEEAVALLS
jgi:hypothetical protein